MFIGYSKLLITIMICLMFYFFLKSLKKNRLVQKMEELTIKENLETSDWNLKIPKLSDTPTSLLSNGDLMKISSNLINSCQDTVSVSLPPMLTNKLASSQFSNSFTFKKSASKMPAYVFDPSQPNPQEKQEIDKYFDKLKAKRKKNGKVPMIRKSELGENQKVFTETQEIKLELIDQFLEKGFTLPSDLYEIELKPIIKQVSPFQSPGDSDKKENRYREELTNMEKWGREGNKMEVMQNLSDSLNKYIQSLDLNKSLPPKIQRKQLKALNFNVRIKQDKSPSFRKNSLKAIRKSHRDTNSNSNDKSTDKMKSAGAKIISQFQTEKYFDHSTTHKFSLEFPKTNKKMGENIMRGMSCKEKIAQLKRHLVQKYLKIPESDYMTAQRKQALFQCQMVKGAKEIMNFKCYQQLEFIRESEDSDVVSKDGKDYFFSDQPLEENQESDVIVNKQQEVQKELEKNRQRLKVQRQRVIEKLRC